MIFFRCNSGHFFSGELCPWDGWSHPDSKIVLELVDRLNAEEKELSIAKLKSAGVKDELIRRLVIVEFGDPEAILDGIYPKQVFVNGKVIDPLELPEQYK